MLTFRKMAQRFGDKQIRGQTYVAEMESREQVDMTEQLELSIDELVLDLDNPRIGSISSQSEALASIVRLNFGYFLNLMASIRDDGLDPGDSSVRCSIRRRSRFRSARGQPATVSVEGAEQS